ncbi:MAG TPA: acylphosphatase [Methanomicrobia archaeon]|nr:acylphosphatase [Methanomicrobia archaeon]
MRERAEIIARGEVQRVGYRDVVERAARKLQLTGFVEKALPYDVRIVCEGERSSIDALVEQIKIKKHPIAVDELEVRFEPATGEFAYFAIKRGDMAEELGERMDVANAMLVRSVALGEESVAIGRKMLEKQDHMLEKQDHMLDKQDIMIEKQDHMLDKQDHMLDKQDETTGEIRSLREDLKSFMDRHFTTIYREISEIKARLGMS